MLFADCLSWPRGKSWGREGWWRGSFGCLLSQQFHHPRSVAVDSVEVDLGSSLTLVSQQPPGLLHAHVVLIVEHRRTTLPERLEAKRTHPGLLV